MVSQRKTSGEEDKPRRPPATSPEARENQLISLAVDLAEKQIIAGTASSQIVSHYLKLGAPRERLEREKLELENALLIAKREAIDRQGQIEELFKNAMDAFRGYAGQEELEERYDD